MPALVYREPMVAESGEQSGKMLTFELSPERAMLVGVERTTALFVRVASLGNLLRLHIVRCVTNLGGTASLFAPTRHSHDVGVKRLSLCP